MERCEELPGAGGGSLGTTGWQVLAWEREDAQWGWVLGKGLGA